MRAGDCLSSEKQPSICISDLAHARNQAPVADFKFHIVIILHHRFFLLLSIPYEFPVSTRRRFDVDTTLYRR